MESRNSTAFLGLSILKFFQQCSFWSQSDCSMMQSTRVILSTIWSLMRPSTAIFRPSSLGIILGIITPGVSTRNINGFCRILNPLRPRVVQTEAVALAAPLLFSRSEIFLIWLMMEDLPTFGMPQIMNHNPTCLYLCLYLSFKIASTLRMSSCFCVDTAKQGIPQLLQSQIILSVLAVSQRSYLLNIITLSF